MLATIGEMDEMIGSTLAFARDEVRAEPRRRVDIAALLASVVDDTAARFACNALGNTSRAEQRSQDFRILGSLKLVRYVCFAGQ